MGFLLAGQTYDVPGAYAITKVIQQGGSAIPAFNVGVIIGGAKRGRPHTMGTGATPATADKFILPFTNEADLMAEYGPETDMLPFFQHAKKQGAGTVFCLNVGPTTALQGGIIVNGSSASAIQIASREYGAQANDTSVTIAASVHTVIPAKNTVFLSANSGTGKTVSLNCDTVPYKVGQTVLITDNSYLAPVSKVIESIDTANKTVTFTVAIVASALTSGYARLFKEDTENQQVSVALDTPAKVMDFYAACKPLSATIFTGVTVMPLTLTKTYAQNMGSATKATSPDVTASEWQAIVTNFSRWQEEFGIANKFYMRVLGIVTSDAANHASFRDLAVAERAKNMPLAIVAGAALGDYALSTSAEPKARAASLNEQDFMLAGIGLDLKAAYLSLAGQLFGIRIASAVNHNITNDDIVASSVEKTYYHSDPALAAMIRAGVVVPVVTKSGFKVSQGVTTYQDQATTFNVASRKTYLAMLRDLADFDLRAMLEVLSAQTGADGITASIVSAVAVQMSERLKNEFKYISGYRIGKIYKSGNAFIIEREIALDSPTDFIGLINTIVID